MHQTQQIRIVSFTLALAAMLVIVRGYTMGLTFASLHSPLALARQLLAGSKHDLAFIILAALHCWPLAAVALAVYGAIYMLLFAGEQERKAFGDVLQQANQLARGYFAGRAG